MTLLIVLLLFTGLIFISQTSSSKEINLLKILEVEKNKIDMEIEKDISRIVHTAKIAFDLGKFQECLVEIEKLQQYNAVNRAFDLKLQCLIEFKEFQTIIGFPLPYSDTLLYYRTISFFELNKFDKANECITLAFKRDSPEKFIQVLHSYINPYEDFEHFWKYIDKESRKMLLSIINDAKFLREFNPKDPTAGPFGVKVNEVTFQDFLSLTQTEELDLSNLSGDGTFQNPTITNGPILNNLGFLKYFGELKVLNLRGQKKLVSSWGINFNKHLKLVNLSDTTEDVISLFPAKIKNNNDIKIFYSDKDFNNANREFSPFWIKHKTFEKYLAFVSEKLIKQDYPQIYFPLCYYDDPKTFKEKLAPTIPDKVSQISSSTGRSESYFKKYLLFEFGAKILLDQSFSLHAAYNPLYPDFVLKDGNLLIDIEIDEPYVYSTKIPTHYYKYDEGRNYQFIMRDWFIIRFSEEQILRYPETCISYLKYFIESIKKGTAIELVEFKNLSEVDFNRKSWTMNDCIEMASNSIRDEYLNYLQR